jgi:hypothetical protein
LKSPTELGFRVFCRVRDTAQEGFAVDSDAKVLGSIPEALQKENFLTGQGKLFGLS